jgi:hypothetical protein
MKGKDSHQGFREIAGRKPSYNIAATELSVVPENGKLKCQSVHNGTEILSLGN